MAYGADGVGRQWSLRPNRDGVINLRCFDQRAGIPVQFDYSFSGLLRLAHQLSLASFCLTLRFETPAETRGASVGWEVVIFLDQVISEDEFQRQNGGAAAGFGGVEEITPVAASAPVRDVRSDSS